MFLARLPQPSGQIHQAGGHDAALGLNHFVGFEVLGRLANGHDVTRGNRHIGNVVQAAGGVDDAAVLNQDFHGCSPPGRPKESRAPLGGSENTK